MVCITVQSSRLDLTHPRNTSGPSLSVSSHVFLFVQPWFKKDPNTFCFNGIYTLEIKLNKKILYYIFQYNILLLYSNDWMNPDVMWTCSYKWDVNLIMTWTRPELHPGFFFSTFPDYFNFKCKIFVNYRIHFFLICFLSIKLITVWFTSTQHVFILI